MTVASRIWLLAGTLLCLTNNTGDAFAWGDVGHKVICEIAIRRVASATRAEINKLIQADPDYNSFADACVWPDHPRKRATEHFLNLPRDSHGLAGDNCAGAPACVVLAIRKDAAVLASKASSPSEKLVSLKFLGHWVGDVHQPLHVSFEDDRGGNSVRISGECQSNLHSAWDTCLVIAAVGSEPALAASKSLASITQDQAQAWLRSSPKDWVNESFAISTSSTTKYCQVVGNSCAPGASPLRIDDEYVQANIPVVREQLLKAGIRLAHLLDESFAASAR